jgi:hypothetical protein
LRFYIGYSKSIHWYIRTLGKTVDENVAKAQICVMGKRGENLFRKNDGLRALAIARDGGMTPAMIEIVAKDGTVFRVYGDNVAPATGPDTAAVKAWDEAIAELKATPKGRGK